jgi:hypothetical protein
MQDNTAMMMTLRALQEIGDGLRSIREELRRLNDLLERNDDSVPRAPSPSRPSKYPSVLPR